jgi:hypothetical protein
MKRLAKPDDVWQYMNPDIKQSWLPRLEPPVFPTWREINLNATSYSDLSVDEREAYQDLKTIYHANIKRYKAKSKALSQNGGRDPTLDIPNELSIHTRV